MGRCEAVLQVRKRSCMLSKCCTLVASLSRVWKAASRLQVCRVGMLPGWLSPWLIVWRSWKGQAIRKTSMPGKVAWLAALSGRFGALELGYRAHTTPWQISIWLTQACCCRTASGQGHPAARLPVIRVQHTNNNITNLIRTAACPAADAYKLSVPTTPLALCTVLLMARPPAPTPLHFCNVHLHLCSR